VVGGIAPWSAPVFLGIRAVVAPLAYGNTVVLKASEQCPRTHAAIVDALTGAGVPAGAINLVTNEPEDAAEVAEELIAHPAVRRISFTGSTRAGRIIAQTAARHLRRVLLELGGSPPRKRTHAAIVDALTGAGEQQLLPGQHPGDSAVRVITARRARCRTGSAWRW
jgi:acyl-CoA reductase-like NAD-dependent aldehyde dehydrogenase